jgi:hypothetical protein
MLFRLLQPDHVCAPKTRNRLFCSRLPSAVIASHGPTGGLVPRGGDGTLTAEDLNSKLDHIAIDDQI